MTTGPASHECEIKLTLAADGYRRLVEALPDRVGEVTQHNLFLDTADLQLGTHRWALRVRREERPDAPPRVVVTLKGPATRMAGAVSRTELEASADEGLWQRARAGELRTDAIPAPPGELLGQVVGAPTALVPQLEFQNHRTTFRLVLGGDTRLVELDRTRFATGEIDHELELELPAIRSLSDGDSVVELKAATDALGRLLASHGLEATPSPSGKYSRARRYAGR